MKQVGLGAYAIGRDISNADEEIACGWSRMESDGVECNKKEIT